MRFNLARTPRLDFGVGSFASVPALVRGRSVVALVTGGSSFARDPRRAAFVDACRSAGSAVLELACAGEPSVEFVDGARSALADLCAERGADSREVAVVAVGGGSAMDAGKAIAAMLPVAAARDRGEEPPSVQEFLEGVGSRPPTGETAFLIACPTTAGTGSEATKNAVISRVGPGGFKKSLRHENYVPAVAVIDPELAVGCPFSVTAASGLDALTQLIESWTSPASSPVTAALCASGVAAFARSFERALEDGGDLEARSGMAYAAFLSGVGLANAGLGAVHALASPLGGRFPLPHGVACGALLYGATRLNVERLAEGGGAEGAGRAAMTAYARAGYLLASAGEASGGDAALQGAALQGAALSGAALSGAALARGLDLLFRELDRLVALARLPRFSDYGVTAGDLAGLAAAAATKTNPVPLSAADYERLLVACL